MQITKSSFAYVKGPLINTEGGIVTSAIDFQFLGLNQTRTGEPNPNYRSQIRNGDNASTPFIGQRGKVTVKDATATLQRWSPSINDPNRVLLSSTTAGMPYSQAEIPIYGIFNLEAALNQALVRAYKDVRQTQYQISGPTFLAEFREAVQMLRRPAAALRDYANSYLNAINTRRSRGGNASRSSRRRVVADTWLEYSFGWSPFLSDIKSAAETIARFNIGPRFGTASGFGESQEFIQDVSTHSGDFSTSSGIFYIKRSVVTKTCKVKVRVGIDASLNAPFGSAESLVQLSGFSMQNFVPAVWEVLPWSFFVDYFSNIGDVLEAVTTDTTSVRRSQINVITENNVSVSWSPDTRACQNAYGQNFVSLTGSLGSYVGTNRRVTRELNGLTYPTLAFDLPKSGSQVANLSALFLAGRRAQS